MKSFKLNGLQKTVIYSCLIIVAGYASVSLISAFLPSYVNTVTVEEKQSENYFLSFEDSSKGLNPLQWIDLGKVKGVALTKQEKKELSKFYVHKIIYKLLYRDIINPAATVIDLDRTIEQTDTDAVIYNALGYTYEDYMLNEIKKVVEDGESYYIYQKEIVLPTNNKKYTIQCKITTEGILNYYHCEEGGVTEYADAATKENVYYELGDMVLYRAELLKSNIQYLRYICDYYGQSSATLNELYRYFMNEDVIMPYTYQVITTDSEMLLMFYGEKTLIMCFDPITYSFTGIYFDL